MKSPINLRQLIEGNRPPDSTGRSVKNLSPIAGSLRDALLEIQGKLSTKTLLLSNEQVNLLAIALTEFAEDLHAELGSWQSLEKYQIELFGTPLPLFCKPGDPPLIPFDTRRFQFFLFTVFGYLKPDLVLSPSHSDLLAIAKMAEDILIKHFARYSRSSDIASFLNSPNKYGWEIKRKLIWLGTKSYLFRFPFASYAGNRPEDTSNVDLVNTFICEHTTQWSGLGPIDILAGALKISAEDRSTLRRWYEGHLSVYRILSLQQKGTITKTMEVTNLVNGQNYLVRFEQERCPFTPDQMVWGSLLPWRNEWYWSGSQQIIQSGVTEDRAIRKNMLEKRSGIAYRYCPDLLEKAREVLQEMQSSFLQAYGSDLAFFPMACLWLRRNKSEWTGILLTRRVTN